VIRIALLVVHAYPPNLRLTPVIPRTALLRLSVKTIEAHRANIMRKLHLRSVRDLVRYTIRNKIVQP
jgi:regulatory LuxR family protein